MDAVNKPMRIAIVGTSGSGKSTLARKLSKILGCDHIDLDAYCWNPWWVVNYSFLKEGVVDEVSCSLDFVDLIVYFDIVFWGQ